MIKYIKEKPHPRLLKSCFWDYNINLEDIEKYISSDNWQLKKFVFQKIISNSPDVLSDLMIFNKNDLLKLLTEYKVPKFNYKFLHRRFQIIRHLIAGINTKILELEWKN